MLPALAQMDRGMMGDRSMMGQGMTGRGMMGSMARHMFCMRNGVPPVLSRPDQFAAGYAKPNSRGRCALRPELRGSSRLDERLAKIAAERETLTADLDRRRIRRDFDLSRVGDEQQRINLARRYVETTDKMTPSVGDCQGTCYRVGRQTLNVDTALRAG